MLISFLSCRKPEMRITASEALEHDWFKTQFAAPPPEQKLPQRSNIIPRVTKQKTIHQLVPAKRTQPEEASRKALILSFYFTVHYLLLARPARKLTSRLNSINKLCRPFELHYTSVVLSLFSWQSLKECMGSMLDEQYCGHVVHNAAFTVLG